MKRLHQAIKELRTELDRVNLAIKQVEVIAEAMSREQDEDGNYREPAKGAPEENK